MELLLSAALSNVVVATVLAVVAAVVGRLCRRPAVRHALWLLVLLKLITPPLVNLPVPWPAAAAAEDVAPPTREPLVLAEPADVAEAPVLFEPVDVLVMEADEPPAATEPITDNPVAEYSPLPWREIVATAWLIGSLTTLAVMMSRGRRFAELLGYGRPAPDGLQREVARLARRIGLASCPEVLLLPGRVAPMVWGMGRGRLLLPQELLDRLDDEGRQALLVHELAHLRRGDHRLRLFEALATALYWWNPVVWWARHELREAEEQCCDAWVLWALPRSARDYALTLVETVDFLSESPAPLPTLASGFGPGDDLRRRVTMIMQGTTPRALGWSGLFGVFSLGALLLPIVPVWADEKAPDKKPLTKEEVRRFVIVNGQDDKDGRVGFAFVVEDDDAKKDHADLARLKADIEKKRAELAAMEAKLRAAADQLAAKAKEQAGKAKEHAGKVKEEIKETIKKKIEAAQEAEKKAKTEQRIRVIIREGDKDRVLEVQPGASAKEVEELIRSHGKAAPKGDVIRVVPVPPMKVYSEKVHPRPVVPAAKDTDQRLAELEKRLETIMMEIKQLRSQGHTPHAAPVPPKPPAPPVPPAAPLPPSRSK